MRLLLPDARSFADLFSDARMVGTLYSDSVRGTAYAFPDGFFYVGGDLPRGYTAHYIGPHGRKVFRYGSYRVACALPLPEVLKVAHGSVVTDLGGFSVTERPDGLLVRSVDRSVGGGNLALLDLGSSLVDLMPEADRETCRVIYEGARASVNEAPDPLTGGAAHVKDAAR